jgi:predicted AlkP superfamily pyrophosphatase or phosphodiesterase
VKLLLYFADAFAWQYLESEPFMPDFWDVQRPLHTIPGYSSSVIPCLLTGKPPVETGIWTEYYYSPRPQSRLEARLTRSRLLPLANLARLAQFRVARKLGFPVEHRLRMPLEVAHLFARHPIDYSAFPPIKLAHPTLADEFAARGLRTDFRFFKRGMDPDQELARAKTLIEDVDVFFYYDAVLDAKAHHVGAAPHELRPEFQNLETFISGLWEELQSHGDTEALLFSDHGMTDVETTADVLAALRNYKHGRDYVAFVDSSFARFWYPRPELREEIRAALADLPAGFMTDADLERYGIRFADDRYGQDVLAADEGVVFHPNYFAPPFLRTRNYPDRGTHGYRPEFPSSDGVVMYRGNRWRETDIPDPVPVTDVFNLALGALEGGPVNIPR